MINKYVSRINWFAVQATVERKLKKKYNRRYLSSVYCGALPSMRIKKVLDKILPPYQKMKKAE